MSQGFFLVWQEMIIQAMDTPFFHLLNTIKMNKWNLTINPKNNVLGNCFIMTPSQHAFDLPWSWFLDVKKITTFGSLSYWNFILFFDSPMPIVGHTMHHFLHDVTHQFLFYFHNFWHFAIQENHFLSWFHHVSFVPTKITCVLHIFVKRCDPFPIMK
jgi:hypothetical protein